MKKIFSIVAVAAALVLVGCAHKQPEPTAPVVEQQQEVCKGKHCKKHHGKFGAEQNCKKDVKK